MSAMTTPVVTERDKDLWHAAPAPVILERDGVVVLIDPEAPNWIATDRRGTRILSYLDGATSLTEAAVRYARDFEVEPAKAFHHVTRFVREAERHRFVSPKKFARGPYKGRSALLPVRLRELWIHTNNSCNLACAHCLVSSGPGEDPGLDKRQLLALIDEAADMGVLRFYFTGGEPFLRRDIFDLIEQVTRRHGRDLRVLTNGILFHGEVLERLRQQDPILLHLQVSLDGASAATNDPIRGSGSFDRILVGVRNLVAAGFAPTLSTVITWQNLDELPALVRLAKDLGARAWHALWPHRKGRWADAELPSASLIYERLRAAQIEAERLGLRIDNVESFRQRANGEPEIPVDLSSAGVESLCVFSDGMVYPSAATAQYERLALGRWTCPRSGPSTMSEERLSRDERKTGGNLGTLLRSSNVARHLRSLTVADKPICNTCKFKFICGGGDIEHVYSFARGCTEANGSVFHELDPYCELYQGLFTDAMFELASAGRRSHRSDTGYGAPVIYHAMGDGNLECAPGADGETQIPVRTSRSNCVLSMDIESSRSLVREFYGNAAETPQPGLCCPISYDADDIAHIPKEVLDRFYGCGGPMSLAVVQSGETVLDLGCGAGIDVFIAAKKVGPNGRAIGVDMTDPMLGVAGESKAEVVEGLGYDVVDLRKGFLESVPAKDGSVDLVTSNCVINLSLDKRAVFREMWRILKDHGRVVLSDIVAGGPVPPQLKVNVHLWGECVSGALPEDEFLAEMERAGFFGLEILKKEFWREVEGHDFYSVTVRGFKFQKTSGCVFLGHRAVYLGPYVSVTDEEGHLFPRGQEIEVCTDTVAKLTRAPYSGSFLILDPGETRGATAARCAPGCC